MSVRSEERRRDFRAPAAHAATIMDARGRVIARGRSANISENGVMIIIRSNSSLDGLGEVLVELTLPGVSKKDVIHGETRTVRYRCRVARVQTLGQLVGLGMEFMEKLA